MPYKMSLDRPDFDQDVLAAGFAGRIAAGEIRSSNPDPIHSGIVGAIH